MTDLRERAFERAAGRCEFPGCEIPRPRLELAHILGKQMGGSKHRDVDENVAVLCQLHHDWLDGRLIPNGRRYENEQLLRAYLRREWKDRR